MRDLADTLSHLYANSLITDASLSKELDRVLIRDPAVIRNIDTMIM